VRIRKQFFPYIVFKNKGSKVFLYVIKSNDLKKLNSAKKEMFLWLYIYIKKKGCIEYVTYVENTRSVFN